MIRDLAASVVPGRVRPRGAPPATWSRAVERDLVELGISGRWYGLCQNREHWRKDVVERLANPAREQLRHS